MRVFVLGAGASGSLLAHLIARQGHTVWCGDKDVQRAHRFLGKKSKIPVIEVNARNLWAITRAGRGCHLLVNASPAVFNEIILRAALRLRAHYLDLAAHLTRNPFKAEQLRYFDRFTEKKRTAVITAGVSPGLTNVLVKRAADMFDRADAVFIRLYESTESEDPVSTWSSDVAFDEAVSRPRVYRDGHFKFAKRFGEAEWFRFPPPIGKTRVVLAAQDEVCTVPYYLPLRDMDVKIGGNEIDRLRRWYRQGKLSRARGLVAKRFPRTPTPRQVAKLIRGGVLHNAHFAAAVVVKGMKEEHPMTVRWDCMFPSLYQIRLQGLTTTPISYATAHMAALFVKHFPREFSGVHPSGELRLATIQAVLGDARKLFSIRLTVRREKRIEDEEEFL